MVISVFVVATAMVTLVALLANPDRYRPQVIAYLEKRTGRQIEIGHLGISLFPTLLVRLSDVGWKNPPPFPEGYVLKAPVVDAQVDVSSLLRGGHIVVKLLVLTDPVINIVDDPDGLWNFEVPAVAGQPTPLASPQPFSLGAVTHVQIRGGRLLGSSLVDPSDRPGPIVFEASGISAGLRQLDTGTPTGTPAWVVEQGGFKAASVRFGAIPTTNVRSKLRIVGKQVFFDNFSVEAHGGNAIGDFTFNLAGVNPTFTSNTQLSGVDVAFLLAQFSNARGKMTGKMKGTLKLEGEVEHTRDPLQHIHGTGSLTIRDGELPTLNQNKDMQRMTRFRDPAFASRPPSSFSAFSADINLANHRIFSHEVTIAFYGIDVRCSGSLGLTDGGPLDYKGVALVMKKQGFFTDIFSRIEGAKLENGKLSFPIKIKGTLEGPKFVVVN
jgi:AsmA-like C-terminal region/AsmA family